MGFTELVKAAILAVPHDTPIEIWFSDEARVGQQGTLTRIWARRGSRPLSPYGITKKLAEDYLAFFKRDRGLDYTALALANVYGPRQDPHGEAGVVAIFAQKMLAGETPTIFGDGTQLRDFTYVDDVVDAFLTAGMNDAANGQVFNVGAIEPVSLREVAELLTEVAGTGSYRLEPFPPDRKASEPK